MGNFTKDWNESTVADTAQASTLGAVDRANQVDLSDRLKALIYGFVAGENDGIPGCKKLHFKQQSGDPTVVADTITLYAKDVSGNNELYTKDEGGNVVQLTSAGTIGAGGVTLLAGKDLIGSATSDITINTDKFTVAGASGNTLIGGTFDIQSTTAVVGILDEDDMSSDSATNLATQQSIKAFAEQKVRARIFKSASSQTVATGNATKVVLDGETYDSGSIAGSNKITPGVIGYYLVIGAANFGSVADTKYMLTMIYKNGAEVARSVIMSTGTGFGFVVPAVDMIYLDADDYVELYVQSDDGNYSISTGTNKTYLALQKIGA